MSDTSKTPVSRLLTGRTPIYTDVENITDDNILEVLERSMSKFLPQSTDITYLFEYAKGNMPVWNKEKTVRKDINNKIVVNRAYECVEFWTGYVMGKPIQYVAKCEDEECSKELLILNDVMNLSAKESKDTAKFNSICKCGVGYYLVLPNIDYKDGDIDKGISPIKIFLLNSARTYVVYSSSVDHKKLLGVTYYINDNNEKIITAYSRNKVYTIVNSTVEKEEKYSIRDVKDTVDKEVPIIEFYADNDRLGTFEPATTIIDAINNIESARADGVDQIVQALLKFKNCEVDEDTLNKILELGALMVNGENGQDADVDYISSKLDQSQAQTLINDLYMAFLTITAMPNRNGGSSTSDTGTAVQLRDGWQNAESRAMQYESNLKIGEKELINQVVELLEIQLKKEFKTLNLRHIDIVFTRRNYENIKVKADVLVEMLKSEKIDPKLAFQHCGMFTDPERAYQISKTYYENYKKQEMDDLMKTANVGNRINKGA